MTFDRLIATVALERQLTKRHTRAVIEHAFEVLRDAVWQDGRVMVPRVGSFFIRTRAARGCRMPRTKDYRILPPVQVVSFRASPNWRRRGP
jgi:nucleoid DNA-binding protein